MLRKGFKEGVKRGKRQYYGDGPSRDEIRRNYLTTFHVFSVVYTKNFSLVTKKYSIFYKDTLLFHKLNDLEMIIGCMALSIFFLILQDRVIGPPPPTRAGEPANFLAAPAPAPWQNILFPAN